MTRFMADSFVRTGVAQDEELSPPPCCYTQWRRRRNLRCHVPTQVTRLAARAGAAAVHAALNQRLAQRVKTCQAVTTACTLCRSI